MQGHGCSWKIIILITVATLTMFFIILFSLLRKGPGDNVNTLPATVSIPKTMITTRRPVKRATGSFYKHAGEYLFNLTGKAKTFNRYPKTGGLKGKNAMPSGIECCCNVEVNDDTFYVCAQGKGYSLNFGLEIVMKNTRHGVTNNTYFVIRHESDLMKGSKCKASWH